MENASRALLIAGGVLLTILIITLLLYVSTSMTEYYQIKEQEALTKEITEFNSSYTNYNRKDVLGYELLSLVNKVIDYNQTESTAGAETGSAAGNYGAYSPITIEIILDLNESEKNLFIRNIECPAPDSSTNLSDLQLLIDDRYTQSDTRNTFEDDILDHIVKLETNSDYTKYYGGAEGIKNLVDNIGSIYLGNIIGYNGRVAEAGWYEADEIVRKYQTLTGITLNDIKNWNEYDEHAYDNEYFNAIKAIRNVARLEDVAKYYEYTQFQKAIFECTKVTYNEETGRVENMTFEFTGQIQ